MLRCRPLGLPVGVYRHRHREASPGSIPATRGSTIGKSIWTETARLPLHLSTPRVRSIAVRLAVVGAAVALFAACDERSETEEDTSEQEQADEEPDRTAPNVDWRAVAEANPAEAASKVGPFDEDCAPEQSLADIDPGPAALLSGLPGACRVSREAAEERATYRIDEISYSAGRPAAIELRPEVDVELAEAGLHALELPRFDAERGYAVAVEDRRVPVRSFRRERAEADLEPGTPLGVDLVAGERGDTTAERALVYVATPDNAGRQLAQWRGPSAVSARAILSASLHATSEHAGVAVELGLDEVRVRRWDDYPVRRPQSEVAPDPLTFSRDALGSSGEDSSWESELEEFVMAYGTRGEGFAPDGPPRATFGIAATQTAPVGEIEALMGALEAHSRASFQWIVRAGDRVAPRFTDYPLRAGMRVEFSSDPPESTSRTGESYLNLRVHASGAGFEIIAGGNTLPPVRGCQDPGPTVCPDASNPNLKEDLDRAKSLQKRAEPSGSDDAVDETLAQFDWVALYRNLRSIHDRYSNASRIYLSADPGLPVAAAVRMMNLARFRLRPSDAEDCGVDFESSDALLDAVPCETDGGDPKAMFDRQIWRME